MKIKTTLHNYDEERKIYIEEFKKIIHGDVFNNRQCRFLVGLTYLNDCDAYTKKISWKEQKEKLFYLTQKAGKSRKYEIEHIASHTFRTINKEVDEIVNHIGNLVFLSAKINKALGKQTADRKKDKSGLEDDFYEKIQVDCPRQNYRSDMNLSTEEGKTDVNTSIISFVESLKNNDKCDFNTIMAIIKDRDIKMIGVLTDIYREYLSVS